MTAAVPLTSPDARTLQARLAALCIELVRIPSPTHHEKALADHLEAWARSLPSHHSHKIVRDHHSLIIGSPDGVRPCIALVGHLDTIPAHEGAPEPHMDGDQIFGVGASDMKGSIAVMQALFETLNLAELPFSLMLVLYEREEGNADENGLNVILQRHEMLKPIDLAVLMEPTNNTLQLGCLGSIHARVTFRGRAAHSARPWEGENAIHKAANLLSTLNEYQPHEVNIRGLTFREALSATMAAAGRGWNIIPDTFEILLNYRFAPVTPLEDGLSGAKRELERLTADGELEIVNIAPPGPVPERNPIVDHIRHHGGLAVLPKLASTDVARLAAHGIDAINFGPGHPSQAHQAGELIELSAMLQAYELLAEALESPLEGL